MKKMITIAALLAFPLFVFSQDITGLWKGTMYNNSSQKQTPYELLIRKEKGKYAGYAQSWFLIDGKEYYGIRKVKVNVAKDGKIVIKDAALMDDNFPVRPDKNVCQLDVLDLVNQENETLLDGMFVTNLTKRFAEVTGHINIKKVNTFSESTLMQFLEKKVGGNEIAVVK